MSGALEFIDAGAGVSIQDLGRSGHRDIGVPLAGAADPVLLACANALLAQAEDLPALEVALLGPTLRAVARGQSRRPPATRSTSQNSAPTTGSTATHAQARLHPMS